MSAIFKDSTHGVISKTEFETALKDVRYNAKDFLKLVQVLDTKGDRMTVSLDKLSDYLKQGRSTDGPRMTPNVAREKYQGFDARAKSIVSRISEFLKRKGITLLQLFESLDLNKDGAVDNTEFVTMMSSSLPEIGLSMSDYAFVFTALDVNHDGTLSLNEFGMFIEGAKLDKMQRMNSLDPRLIQDMQREIDILFQQFDINNDGKVSADELMIAMRGLKQVINIEQAQQMIRQVDVDGDGSINRKEFSDLMIKQMKEELLSQEDNVDELRMKFLDADIDCSGTLTVDEIYSALLKMGAELTMDELVELMHEIDVDRTGSLDIDEFVAMMSLAG